MQPKTRTDTSPRCWHERTSEMTHVQASIVHESQHLHRTNEWHVCDVSDQLLTSSLNVQQQVAKLAAGCHCSDDDEAIASARFCAFAVASSQESCLVFGKEIVFLVLSGKKISPAAPRKLALRAAARSVVTNLGFHCGASSCAHFSDNDSFFS